MFFGNSFLSPVQNGDDGSGSLWFQPVDGRSSLLDLELLVDDDEAADSELLSLSTFLSVLLSFEFSPLMDPPDEDAFKIDPPRKLVYAEVNVELLALAAVVGRRAETEEGSIKALVVVAVVQDDAMARTIDGALDR
jgi:hypothetical protein